MQTYISKDTFVPRPFQPFDNFYYCLMLCRQVILRIQRLMTYAVPTYVMPKYRENMSTIEALYWFCTPTTVTYLLQPLFQLQHDAN